MARTITYNGKPVLRGRDSADLTPSALAAACQLSRSYVSRVLRGERDVPLSTAKQLADAAGCSLDELWARVQQTQ